MVRLPELASVRPFVSSLCLINWDRAASMVDDSSYENWIEGTRLLDAAMASLPMDVVYVTTGILSHIGLTPTQALAKLDGRGVKRVFCAGNAVEQDVIDFALHVLPLGIESVLLFDVCGTRDPMAKWQALAAAVDRGVRVSTVQQSLGQIAAETDDPLIRQRIRGILSADFGEHALELSAA